MRFNNLYFVPKKQVDPWKHSHSTVITINSNPQKKFNISAISPDTTSFFCWLGHSSIFIHLEHCNLLIDPIFSKRVSPLSFIGPKRHGNFIVQKENFPHIDAILITHNHYDHLDKKAIVSLNSKTDHFIVPLGIKKNLLGWKIPAEKIIELNWNEKAAINNVDIICMAAHHNSCRTILDSNKTLWCSYIIKNDGYTLFHSGDTAFSPHFNSIHQAFPTIDIAFMECGQYGESWHHLHMFPEESVEACKLLNPKLSIPIHWGSFQLAYHSLFEPPYRFEEEAQKHNVCSYIPKELEIYYFNKMLSSNSF